MILVINVCKEKLHYYEFVKPIEDIIKKEGIDFFTRNYDKIKQKDLNYADKVIICGTSLLDDKFLKNIEKFSWIKEFDKPIFGICAGMQIIGKVFGEKIKEETEIGFYHENFEKNFLGLFGEKEVYHLHNNYIDFGKEFLIYSKSKIIQAVKHKEKEIYAVLFHPEVRNKEVIKNFLFI